MYLEGRGVPQSYEKAAAFFCMIGGRNRADPWRRMNDETVSSAGPLEDVMERAKSGNADAQYILGLRYNSRYHGYDFEEAAKWFRLAAEQGHVSAIYEAGKLYWRGRGVVSNRDKAEELFRLAAEHGHMRAQYRMAKTIMIVIEDDGRMVNYEDAVKWYRLAAEQGCADAKYDLSRMYRLGKGVPQDEEKAVRLLKEAAEQGYADAQCDLGMMYHRGNGVPTDHEEAVKWFKLFIGPSKD